MSDAIHEPVHGLLYAQIVDHMVRMIGSGALIEGERLPPERRLAADLGVSVGTLRRALDDLARRGLIERRHGSGNYVRPLRGAGGLYGFFRLERVAGGGLPEAETFEVTRRDKPAGAPEFGPSTQAHRIRRLRRIGGLAVALEEIWVDAGWGGPLEAADLGPALYHALSRRLGLRIVRVEDRVGVGAVPGWGAAALGLSRGAPCGHVVRIGWAQTGARAEFSTTWFDHDKARYVARMK